MKTNPRNYKRNGNQFAFVLDSINVENYNLDPETTSDKEKVSLFFKCYNQEFNHEWNKKQYPNECQRIGEYIQGLPSCFNTIYWEEEIIKIGQSWGYCQTNKKASDFVNNWFRGCGFRLLQLKEIFGI